MKLRIYLADLTHTGSSRVATEAFPLNIGLNASYAKKVFGNDIDITLFKYPQDLLEALKQSPPHILGCSNYTWNSNLSYHFAEFAKFLNPETLTIWGGTNYPFLSTEQKKFLQKRPHIDAHIFYEGEQVFVNIIERFISVQSINRVLSQSIDGCQFLSKDGSLVTGSEPKRLTNLDDIPSPYATGLLDKFFDGVLAPLVETARGCPFACNFCNAGDKYFDKLNKFSDDYVQEELTYIAKRASGTKGGHVTFADNNFGMIPRDAKTAQLVGDLQRKYDWPQSMTVWTGKNSKERVIDATRILGSTLQISMSVQSLDPQVQENIERSNINLQDFYAISNDLHAQGRYQHSEVIMPLPGESFQSHIDGLNALLDTKMNRVQSHTIQMLHGTPYKDDDEFLQRYDYKTKFRIVPLDFSEVENEKIFDVEQVGIATKDMDFKEYVEARKYLLITDLCHSSNVLNPLQRYLSQNSVKNSAWILEIYQNLHNLPSRTKEIFGSFEKETIEELWDSEEELIAFYSKPENYKLLKNGHRGGNVLFKHRAWILSKEVEEWIKWVFDKTTARFFCHHKNIANKTNHESELKAVMEFIQAKVRPVTTVKDLQNEVTLNLDYDITCWLNDTESRPLSHHKLKTPVKLLFDFPDENRQYLMDNLSNEGVHLSNIIKLAQRGLMMPFRSASYAEPLTTKIIDTPT
jgi:radical SAM superfamily enzyme YgiQ (UPF0313 family)